MWISITENIFRTSRTYLFYKSCYDLLPQCRFSCKIHSVQGFIFHYIVTWFMVGKCACLFHHNVSHSTKNHIFFWEMVSQKYTLGCNIFCVGRKDGVPFSRRYEFLSMENKKWYTQKHKLKCDIFFMKAQVVVVFCVNLILDLIKKLKIIFP